MGMVVDKIKGTLLHKHKAQDIPAVQQTALPAIVPGAKFPGGYLYNWYAANNAANITPAGWRLPTGADWMTLMAFLDPVGTRANNVAAKTIMSNVQGSWAGQEGTNTAAANMYAPGRRLDTGVFQAQLTAAEYWSSSAWDTGIAKSIACIYSGAFVLFCPQDGVGSNTAPQKYGLPLRPIKITTALTNGQTGTYTQNDGTVLPTICIGTIEMVACNIRETKYRTGASIPNLTDPALWAADTTGAMCAYNNDQDTVGGVTAVSMAQAVNDLYDPTAAANKTLQVALKTAVEIAANTQAENRKLYIFTASCTLTLPLSPVQGDKLWFSNMSGTITPIIARNGSKIMGLAEDMTIDKTAIGGELYYSGANYGWLLI